MIAAAEFASRLRAERERQGLTAQQAAEELRLDARIIEALESGDFDNVGAPVYAKGHLKKYAALLGIPAADGAAALEGLNVPPPELVNADIATRIATGRRIGRRVAKRSVVGVAALAALIVGVLWWKPWRLRFGTEVAHSAAASAALRAEPRGTAAAPGAFPRAAKVAVAGAPPAASRVARSPTSAPTPAPAAAPGRAALRFRFAAACWIDVHDASGAPLYRGIASAGSVRSLAGRAPFTVILGHAAGVAMRVGDRPVAIAASYVNGNVARFVVDAGGALRPLNPAARAQL